MDKKILKTAADLMRELGLSEVCIKDGETEIIMKRELTVAPLPVSMPDASPTAAIIDNSGEIASSFSNYKEVKAPLIGIFYDAPSPEAGAYVHVGDKVKRGDTLCIVEAMKMMNEICAECDGVIVDICAVNGAMVEYGQTLFKISE